MTKKDALCAFLKAAKAQKKRCRMFKLCPSVAKGLPEGVCDTSKGAVWTEQKGIKAKEKLQMNGAFLH